MAYWLMKSEPGEFSLDDLTFVRGDLRRGDLAFRWFVEYGARPQLRFLQHRLVAAA